MLRSIKDIIGYPIEAKDGRIGKVKDCLFDDRHWILRYLVADTGSWLPGKKVLISQLHLETPDVGYYDNHFPVNLTKRLIKDSPGLDSNAPVSRQFEKEYARYYGHDLYWDETSSLFSSSFPTHVSPPETSEPVAGSVSRVRNERVQQIAESHLRSSSEILGYHIDAEDDEFGHVEDFILDDQIWKFRYLVIDPKNWLPSKKRLIDIDWVHDFDWREKRASIGLTRKSIEQAPEFDPREPVNEDYLKNLYDYYGHPIL